MTSITRVDYHEGQRLTAKDLRAEQIYRLAAAGRHHLGPHDWGLVCGLRVVRSAARELTIEPGLAIDGYGREILVPGPERVTIDDPAQCWAVLLYYCDRPEQVPPGRACADFPPPRTAQRFVVRVARVDPGLPPSLEDLGGALAAGTPAGKPAWPVLLAHAGTACLPGRNQPFVDTTFVRYTWQRAAAVYGASARALLQLGLRNREDVYHFLLSTRGGTSGLERRIGIDRDGDVHVWRPLVLTGRLAAARFALASRVGQLTTVMPAGLGRQLRIEGLSGPRGIEQLRLIDSGLSAQGVIALDAESRAGGRPQPIAARSQRLVGRSLAPLSGLPAGTSPAAALTLRVVNQPGRRRKAAAVASEPLAFSGTFAPFGGRLIMDGPAAQPAPGAGPTACGDTGRFRQETISAAPVVQFRPGVAIPPDDVAREVHAVTVSAATEPVPRSELRVSGGGEDPSDLSSRIALGRQHTKWQPVLQMDGGGGLHLLGKAKQEALKVSGAIYLPAIGRTDPLLAELMAMAFMSGLPVVQGLTLNIAFPAGSPTPPEVRRGAPFEYKLTWSSLPGIDEVKRCFETISAAEPPRNLSFRTIPNPTASPTNVTKAVTMHRIGPATLHVLVLVQRNQKSRLAIASQNIVIVA